MDINKEFALSNAREQSITGRDGYIVAQALYSFIREQKAKEANDDKSYEWSNTQDAIAILNTMGDGYLASIFQGHDKYNGRTPINLIDEKEPRKAEPMSTYGTGSPEQLN